MLLVIWLLLTLAVHHWKSQMADFNTNWTAAWHKSLHVIFYDNVLYAQYLRKVRMHPVSFIIHINYVLKLHPKTQDNYIKYNTYNL